MFVKDKIQSRIFHSKTNSDLHGEVFTPFPLIEEMLSTISEDHLKDPSKTYFDPAAGKGNFQAVLVEKLMLALTDHFPDEQERYKHIMESQIYMAEFQKQSAMDIETVFNPDRKLKLNLYVGDTLLMPDEFFDLPFEQRILRYPQHYVWGNLPDKFRPKPGKPFIQPLF